MDAESLRRRLAESDFAEHSEWLLATSRPAIDMEMVDVEPGPGESRFGGWPDLPADMPWPQAATGPYRFVAQIDCATLPRVETDLPRAGLLAFFVALESDDGAFFWQSPGYVKAFLFPPDTPLVSTAPPEAVAVDRSCGIRFRAGIDIPADQYQVDDWPLGDDYGVLDDYTDFRESLRSSPHYLLGYPTHNSLAYDPAQHRDNLALLTLDSDDDFEWMWHEGDRLMVFIRRDRLAGQDFSVVTSDAG